MAIIMCHGDHCPIKKDCHRCTAVPTECSQAYMAPPFGKDTINNCDHFWDNWNQRKNIKLELE